MTDYNEILIGEIDPGSPITTSLMTRIRDNVLGIAEGTLDTAPVPRVAIDLAGKTAIGTDETSTAKVLRPDGAGGAFWGAEGATAPPHYIRYNIGPNGGGSAENAVGGIESVNDGGWVWSGAGELTVPETGVYMIWCKRENVTTIRDYSFQVNGVKPPYLPSGLDVWEFTAPVRLTAGDIVRIRTPSSTSGGGTFTLALVRV